MGKFFHSLSLLAISRNAATQAPANDGSVVAIVFAVAAIESLVNELVDKAVDTIPSQRDSRLETLAQLATSTELVWKGGLADRIQLLATILNGKALDAGALPFQDFQLLVSLRNTIVHQRPESVDMSWPPSEPMERTVHKLAQALANRGVVTIRTDAIQSLLGILQQRSVGAWAHNTAASIVLAIVENAHFSHWPALVGLDRELLRPIDPLQSSA